MPVRTRARDSNRGRPQRLSTHFGELETTPTSHRHGQVDPAPAARGGGGPGQETQPLAGAEKYDDGLDDEEFAGLGDAQSSVSAKRRRTSFQWSETESLARRSSPLCPDDTTSAAWQFGEDESLPPLSTPRSEGDHLPDTVPLPDDSAAAEGGGGLAAAPKKTDFSETASTMRRSSPVGLTESVKEVFDFFDDPALGSSPSLPPDGDNCGEQPARPSTLHQGQTHLPIDNIYDVTPPRVKFQQARYSRQTATAVRQRGSHQPARVQLAMQENGSNEENRSPETADPMAPKNVLSLSTKPNKYLVRTLDDRDEDPQPQQVGNVAGGRIKQVIPAEDTKKSTSGTAQETASKIQHEKGKNRRQRPKSPLQFDETNQVMEAPAGALRIPRMPIVSALRDSAQPSSSSNAVPRKRGAVSRKLPRKKKAKTTSAKSQKQTPLQSRARQAADQGSVPSKQRTAKVEKVTRQDEDMSCPNPDLPVPSVSPPEPILVSSEDDDVFSERPSNPAEPENDEAGHVVRPKTTPPRFEAEKSKRVELDASSHDMTAAVVDEDFPELAPAVDCDSQHVGLADSRKLLNSRGKSGRTSHAADIQKQEVAVNNPLPTKVRPSERQMSRNDWKQGRTVRQTTRNYSISAHGSPLPTNRTTSPRGPTIAVEAGSPRRRCSPARFLEYSQPRAAGEDASNWRANWMQRGLLADGLACRLAQQRDATTEPLQGVPGDVREQILASLREHDTRHEEHQRRRQAGNRVGQSCVDEDESGQVGLRESLVDNLSRQLHQVVNSMLRHLKSKEAAGHKVSEIYRANTTGCIEKIRSRQSQERRALAEAMRVDGDKFGNVILKAKSAVARDSQLRMPGMRELEKSTTERQALYDRAITSLRTLHRQLLHGGEVLGKD